MKRVSVLLIILGLMILPGTALSGSMLFNTGPFPCDGQARTWSWWNTSGTPVLFHIVRHWHGATYGATIDFQSQVNRVSDKDLLTIFQQDRYALPNYLTHTDLYFTSPYSVAPGDGLTLFAFCQPFGPGWHGHVTIAGW